MIHVVGTWGGRPEQDLVQCEAPYRPGGVLNEHLHRRSIYEASHHRARHPRRRVQAEESSRLQAVGRGSATVREVPRFTRQSHCTLPMRLLHDGEGAVVHVSGHVTCAADRC